jgi:hypothetical protein
MSYFPERGCEAPISMSNRCRRQSSFISSFCSIVKVINNRSLLVGGCENSLLKLLFFLPRLIFCFLEIPSWIQLFLQTYSILEVWRVAR